MLQITRLILSFIFYIFTYSALFNLININLLVDKNETKARHDLLYLSFSQHILDTLVWLFSTSTRKQPSIILCRVIEHKIIIFLHHNLPRRRCVKHFKQYNVNLVLKEVSTSRSHQNQTYIKNVTKFFKKENIDKGRKQFSRKTEKLSSLINCPMTWID